MRAARPVAAAITLITFAVLAQTPQLKPELPLFHPPVPLSYEVATIKPVDPNTADRMVKLPLGASLSPLSIRRYIMNAYGAIYEPQIIGGPDWINKDAYEIKGKASDELEAAFQTMKRDDRNDQDRAMQQSLLADRFHLKAHFETRVLPVYELVPAKSGLKITAVPAPPDRKPGDPPMALHPGDKLPPGTMMTMLTNTGLRTTNAKATTMKGLARMMGAQLGDTGNRPIVDHTGFSGYFDITDLNWAPLGDAAATTNPDAPSLTVALEEKLGIKLVPARDPIEILVIDSIDRPSEN